MNLKMERIKKLKKYMRLMHRKGVRLQRKLAELGLPDYSIVTIFSVAIGIATGLAAVLFHDTVHLIRHFLFDDIGNHFFGKWSWLIIVFPAAGMLLQSLMIQFAPEVAGRRGVLEVIKAVALRGGHIPFRTTLFHFLAPAINIGSGGTVGPEGPIAQLGGGVASKLGAVFGLSDSRRRMFTAAGSGAAIAAVFNTPLGGVFFALEVILLNDFHAPTFSALILASVSASAVSHMFLGDQPAFVFTQLHSGTVSHYYLYAILGLSAGLVSLYYLRYTDQVSRILRLSAISKTPRWLRMTTVGLMVGICGYYYPLIFGVGYDAINAMLADALSWKTVFVLLLMKFVLVPMVLGVGGFGGIFAPSLFMGGCLGFLFATSLNVLGGMSLDITAFVLVGMGAVLGGINSIPISAILIIFEMTREYSFMLPLMLGVVISTTIVRLALRDSIYNRKLEQQGYRLSSGRDTNILRRLLVRDNMRNDVMLIEEDLSLPELVERMLENPHHTFYTVNSEKKITGMISESELRPIITDYETLRSLVVAHDVTRPGVITVRDDDNLQNVMQMFAKNNVDEFPVISALQSGKVIGAIRRQDVLLAYNRESLKFNLVDGFANEIRTLEKAKSVSVSGDYSLAERPVPPRFIGKTIAGLRLRNEYNVEVLMIRQLHPFAHADDAHPVIMASPDYQIHEGDTLVLFGKDSAIEKTANWK